MATPNPFNERDVIRREIQQITTQQLQQTTNGRIKRRMIVKHSMVLENVLYKRAPCMEYYSDLSTLESRLMKAAEAIFAYRSSAAASRLQQ